MNGPFKAPRRLMVYNGRCRSVFNYLMSAGIENLVDLLFRFPSAIESLTGLKRYFVFSYWLFFGIVYFLWALVNIALHYAFVL